MTDANTIVSAQACGVPTCVCARSVRFGSGRTHCPSHDDAVPSLNVSGANDKLLVHCHGGCTQEAVIAVLRERGLWYGVEPTTKRRIAATYAYVDEQHKTLYEVVRYEPKGFTQRRPDGRGGWVYKLDGVRRVLYDLPTVLDVAKAGWRVYIDEGEKDADAGTALGQCHTTAPGGAGKWHDAYADALTGAEVVVIADKDECGRAHAQEVARSASRTAKSVRVLELPGDHVKDLSDWLSAGGTKADLELLADNAPLWSAKRNDETRRGERRREFNGNELVAETGETAEIIYLTFLGLLGYIVAGWSHLLAGYPRAGKTELLVRLIREWLDTGARVLFITEESEDLWRKRLSRQGGDWSGLQVLFGLGVPPVELRARAFNGVETIIVLDATRNLLQLKDENDNSEVAREVNPWIIDARRTLKTFIAAHHNRKGGGEHGEGIAGGHALLGSFDVGLELLWTNSAQPRRRTIRAYSRVVSPEEFVYELGDDGAMRVLGAPADVALEGVSGRVTEAVESEWRTTREVFGSLGDPKPSEEQVRKALKQAATDGKIERDPPIDKDAKGQTHRWRLPPTQPPTKEPSVGG